MIPEERIEKVLDREEEQQEKVLDVLDEAIIKTWPDLVRLLTEVNADREAVAAVIEEWADEVMDYLEERVDIEHLLKIAVKNAHLIAGIVDYEGEA